MRTAHYLNKPLNIDRATQPSSISGPLGDQLFSFISHTVTVLLVNLFLLCGGRQSSTLKLKTSLPTSHAVIVSWVQPPIFTISSNLAIVAKLGNPKCL